MLDAAMKTKAQWVADLMKADGVKPEHLTEELVFAYMDAITRKINAMQAAYLTNKNYQNTMREFVAATV